MSLYARGESLFGNLGAAIISAFDTLVEQGVLVKDIRANPEYLVKVIRQPVPAGTSLPSVHPALMTAA